MAAKTSLLEVVFFHGPPFLGKTIYYDEHFQMSHKRISPSDIWQEDPSVTLRQIVNSKVLPIIKKGLPVVIDDHFKTLQARQSYIGIIKSKTEKLALRCIAFEPTKGKEQLSIAREYALAENVIKGQLNNVPDFTDWLETRDEPSEDEGLKIENVSVPLRAFSRFKFEVQLLLIEWDCIVKYKEGLPEIGKNVGQVISAWHFAQPCGRIVIVQDPSTIPGVTSVERQSHMKRVLRDLIQETKCPIYSLILEDCGEKYMQPPDPGLLYFLQRLHCLDLNSKNSLMLYQTINFQQMAAYVGLHHIKGNRAFSNPKLVNAHGECLKVVPATFLPCHLVLPETETERLCIPCIPLYDRLSSTARDTVFCCDVKLGNGRVLFLGAHNFDVIQAYQEKYKANASSVGSEDSKIAKLSFSSRQTTPLKQPTLKKQKSVSRGLPTWMLSKGDESRPSTSGESSRKRKMAPIEFKTQESSSLESNKTNSSKSPKGTVETIKTLEYFMNERELYETAQAVWEAAGNDVPSEQDILQYQGDNTAELSNPPIKKTRKAKTGKQKLNVLANSPERERDSRDQAPIGDNTSKIICTEPTLRIDAEPDFAVPKVPPTRSNSSKSSRSTRSSSDATHLSDSFVASSASLNSKASSRPSSSQTIGDSFASESSKSMPSEQSPQSVTAVANSYVTDTSLESLGRRSAQSDRSPDIVEDSYVSKTDSNKSDRSSLASDGLNVADSYVSATVTNVSDSERSGSSSPSSRRPTPRYGAFEPDEDILKIFDL